MTEFVQLQVPHVYSDNRGEFMEIWRQKNYPVSFIQMNASKSRAGVLRGLHYQVNKPQAKLIRCVRGSVFDVAVDLRKNSRTFGDHFTYYLTEINHYQLYIPAGFAHGFLALTYAEVEYLASVYYSPDDERVIRWNDPDLGIPWPIKEPILSPKDAAGVSFAEADYYADLPV